MLEVASKTIIYSSKVFKAILVLLWAKIFIINGVRQGIVSWKLAKELVFMHVFYNFSLNVFFTSRTNAKLQFYYYVEVFLTTTKILIDDSNQNVRYELNNIEYKIDLWITIYNLYYIDKSYNIR